jgi:outer membrane receptor protein involved in Fe transport
LAVSAQTQAQTEAPDEAVEEIVVTGSRIARSNLSSPSPVTTIDATDIKRSGETDISSLLREIPALNSSLPANQSDQNGAPAGVGLLDLRGLGSERTLVLINGRRHVSGVAGTAAVDVTSIPVALIERVETLTGGASAIYGADAVSGAVNFILRDDFEGLDVRSQFGISERGDSEDLFLSATGGTNFADGRGNAVVSVEYTQTGNIKVEDRPNIAGLGFAAFVPNSPELAARLGVNPDAVNSFAQNARLPVSSPFGIIWLQDQNNFNDPGFINLLDPGATVGGFPIAQIVDETGTLRAFNPADIFLDLFNGIGGDAVPGLPNIGWLQPKLDRVNVNGNVNYKVLDQLNFFIESKFSYNATKSVDQVNGFNDDIPISLDNGFIPTALRSQIDSLIGQGITPVLTVSRDNLDVPAQTQADQYSFRVVTGIDGEFDNGWNYEVSYNFGRTERNFTNLKTRIEDRFFAAVDSVIDPDSGEVVCRSDLDPTAIPPISPFPAAREGFLSFNPGSGQCAPINIFGANTTSEAAEEFIFQRSVENSELTQQVISGFISGDTAGFIELPGGAIGFAAGAEYREEKSEFEPNAFETAGLSFNSVTTSSEPVDGRFDVWEVFGEVNIPIISDVPFIKDLSIDGAVRYADYSTVGSTVSWNVGGSYAPVDDIRFRGTFGRSVRAPNINELFSPPQPIFIDADFDPCNANRVNAGTEFRAQNCQALVGDNFNSTNFNSAFVTGRAGGNPDLAEEEADTLTIGAVITPRWIPGLSATVDFYDVEISDAIIVVSAERIIENCVDAPSLDNEFCALVTRDPVNRNITFFESGQQNVAALEARGIDFEVSYGFDLADLGLSGNWGSIDIRTNGTRNLRRRDFDFQEFSDQFDNQLGENTFPKWIVNTTATWQVDQYSLSWQTRFQSSQLLPNVENLSIESDPLFADPFSSGNAFVHDLSASYDITDRFQIYGGVNNIADRKPFLSNLVRPVSFVGRSFFIGFNGTF